MSGTTLSLTMRPTSFDEVIGLEVPVRTIKNKIDSGEIPRGILIVGTYGCGKTTLAWIISQYIQGPLFEGTPVVQEVNGANARKIDDMRKLADSAGSYPMVGTYNVIILDECQQLTPEAQQILLKELEVPHSPTIWILCTTDPQKINSGVKDRCFKLEVSGMDEKQRHELVARAVKESGHTEDTTEFEAELTKAKLVSPRKILQAFETYHNGTPARQAVAAQHYENLPEFFDIAFGVVHGNWDKPFTISWMKDKRFAGVGENLEKLNDRLKKKKMESKKELTPDEEMAAENLVEDDDLANENKASVAQAIRIILATLLSNQVRKGGAKAAKAAECLNLLGLATGTNGFGMEWPLTIGALYRIYTRLRS